MRPTIITISSLRVVLTAAAVAAVWTSIPAHAQSPRALPDAVADLARQLEAFPFEDDERADGTPGPTRGDTDRPVVGLRIALAELERLHAADQSATKPLLRTATALVRDAWHRYAAGSRDLMHLDHTIEQLRQAQVALHRAVLRRDPIAASSLDGVRDRLARLARRMANDVAAVAERAGAGRRLLKARREIQRGDLAAVQGDYVTATVHFGGGLAAAASTVAFDIARFKANIDSALGVQTIGHAYSIAFGGQLYQGGESQGIARGVADAPLTPQSPDKEMHVASVSKTLTTIVTLRLLEENGLTPDALVLPYLPGNWVIGDGVDTLRFRHFMTHTSGFGQIEAGSSYESLQTAIATDVGGTSWSYRNANFGLMRVLVAGLLGIDPTDYPDFDPGALTAAVFLDYARDVYASIGVDVDCAPTDDTPTVQYNFPFDGLAGYVEPDRRLLCGGYGWFISSNELASVLAHLRHTELLLSATMRATMQELFLGFMDPANYDWINGAFGVYSMHGGDWTHDAGELHSCAISFPITVEAALVINSERGAMPYQCDLLETAFDDAWVAN
jgi:D-alanyl-D-alanine carboxypeptidase